MPGKEPRVLCPVCQVVMPPDETECRNCGAFVIDEALVRLSRAFGIDREKALALFEAGFRHPTQLADRSVDRVLETHESGLLFLCTNCGSFVAVADRACSRCAVEFEAGSDEPLAWSPGDVDILDVILCPTCGEENEPLARTCDICGTRFGPAEEAPPDIAVHAADSDQETQALLREMEDLEATLRDVATEPAPSTKNRTDAPPVGSTLSTRRSAPGGPPAQARTSHDRRGENSRSRPTEGSKHDTGKRLPSPRKLPSRRRGRGLTIELLGSIMAAGAPGLYAVQVWSLEWMAAGIAVLLTATCGYVLRSGAWKALKRLERTDLRSFLLAIAFGVVAPLVASLDPSFVASASATGLSTVLLAWMAWRTRRVSGRASLLVCAGGLPMTSLAAASALRHPFAGSSAWIVALAAAVVWPSSVVVLELRARWARVRMGVYVDRAERSLAHRDFEGSIKEFDRALRFAGTGAQGRELPWHGKGAALTILGRYDEALRAIDEALDINPRNEVAWVNKGNALSRMGRPIDALRSFNAAIKVNPAYEVAWNNKGNALARLGHFEEALTCYEHALAIDQGYRGAWVNKGYVLAKLGRYDEAAKCADHVLGLTARGAAGSP